MGGPSGVEVRAERLSKPRRAVRPHLNGSQGSCAWKSAYEMKLP
jgi:hypothetical protein